MFPHFEAPAAGIHKEEKKRHPVSASLSLSSSSDASEGAVPYPALSHRGPRRDDFFTRQLAGRGAFPWRPSAPAPAPQPVELGRDLTSWRGTFTADLTRLIDLRSAYNKEDARYWQQATTIFARGWAALHPDYDEDDWEKRMMRRGAFQSWVIEYDPSFDPALDDEVPHAPEWLAITPLKIVKCAREEDLDQYYKQYAARVSGGLKPRLAPLKVFIETHCMDRFVSSQLTWYKDAVDASSSYGFKYGNMGGDYMILRAAGFRQDRILTQILPHHDLVTRGLHCDDCNLPGYVPTATPDDPFHYYQHPQFQGSGWLDDQTSVVAMPEHLTLFSSRQLRHTLAATGDLERYERTNRTVRLASMGELDLRPSFEALAMHWPFPFWPDMMQPYMPPGVRKHGREPTFETRGLDALHPGFARRRKASGLARRRFMAIKSDWHANLRQLDLIRAALRRSVSAQVYLMAVSDLLIGMQPDQWRFRAGLVLDFSPVRPGIVVPARGFFPLRSSSPNDPYFAWLLAILLMDLDYERVFCFAVESRPRAAPTPPSAIAKRLAAHGR